MVQTVIPTDQLWRARREPDRDCETRTAIRDWEASETTPFEDFRAGAVNKMSNAQHAAVAVPPTLAAGEITTAAWQFQRSFSSCCRVAAS